MKVSVTSGPRTLAPLYLSGSVRRWHANPALAGSGQTNADHQGRCVLLLLALNPDAGSALIRAVASHDVGEFRVGDLAGPFKRACPELAAAHAAEESRAREDLFGPDIGLIGDEADWLCLIDQLEAHCWCLSTAPLEYLREASGWLAAEDRLTARAKRLGVWPQVAGLLTDLVDGDW